MMRRGVSRAPSGGAAGEPMALPQTPDAQKSPLPVVGTLKDAMPKRCEPAGFVIDLRAAETTGPGIRPTLPASAYGIIG